MHLVAVVLLLMLMVLTFLGTLEQAESSLYDVQRKYFESFEHLQKPDPVYKNASVSKFVNCIMREGKRTLPLIALLERAKPIELERVWALLRRRALEPVELAEIRQLVLEHEGVAYARARAHAYARKAKADLEIFPLSEERETLALVADFVVDRDR